MGQMQNIMRAAMLGMAVGDAMGNPVDRSTLEEICRDYGPHGLLGYDLVGGYAEVTSYTQLAAFAANGMLLGLTRGRRENLPGYVGLALKEWSRTQQYSEPARNYCWITSVPELRRRRCMDTCMLDALSRGLGTLEDPQYRSNLPSSLTTVIPVALMAQNLGMEQNDIDRLAAQTVVLTHGEPEAFLSGAVLAHAVCLLAKEPEISLDALLQQTTDAIQQEFGLTYGQTVYIWELLQCARMLSHTDRFNRTEAMERLRCRTAPEVLAGVVYACATCDGDFDTALITAVNHSGRSAAVGAVTGTLMSIRMGETVLPEFYLECLESGPLLGELAADMARGSTGNPMSRLFDDDWESKYIHGQRP